LSRIVFAFQHDDLAGSRDVPIDPVQQPVLSFGLNVGGTYSELDMPLDGQDGRPTLALLTSGQAHHVAATYDSASGLKAIYVDGALAFSANLPAGSLISSGGASTAYIGNMSGRQEPFTGVIDEMVFWSKALTAAEIASHVAAFQGGLGYFTSGGGQESVRLAFNEVNASSGAESWIEIVNHGEAQIDLAGFVVVNAGVGGGEMVLSAQSLAPGGYLTLTEAQLGFTLAAGNRLFLYPPLRNAVIDAVRIQEGLRGRHPEATGEWLSPAAPTAGATNEFALHDEIVINEVMYHPRPLQELPPQTEDTVLVPIDASWRYDESGDDLGTAWRQAGFDDSSWPSGPALFYNETGNLPAPKNTPLELGAVTFYFRARFDYSGNPADAQIYIRPVVDDGAVFHLNGVEAHRFNMPDGAIDASTLASVSVGNAVYTGPFALPTGSLVAGSNLLAVEVHQSTASSTDVVFGVELFSSVTVSEGRPYGAPPASWLELYNRSDRSVDLSGWKLDGGIEYSFENGATLAPGGYLVIAEDRSYLEALHPSAPIVGDFTGRLSNRSDLLILRDADGNPANTLRYHDDAPWPLFADGGGSSLELRDPWADSSRPEAWAASDEGSRSEWKTYTYDEVATANIGPTTWNEFIIGLLDAGEVLVDDIHVIEDPAGTAVELIQNPTFETGATAWRLLGNHRHSAVIADPDNASNHVLHLVATGPTEHMHNHLETTLRGGETVNNGRTYRVSFRARWLAGSNQVHSRLYFNRVPETTLIDVPEIGGTPGAVNSRFEGNIGPTFSDLRHAPAVPSPGEEVAVSVTTADPDGVSSCTLWWSVNGGTWSSAPMSPQDSDSYLGTIPGQASGAAVQFYAEAADGRGASATSPAGGRDSRAVYRVDDGQADLGDKHNLRIVMTPGDTNFLHLNTNVMSNDRMGATVIYDEREVYYDVGVRLKGSERGRNQTPRVGFNIRYPSDNLFRGVHRTTAIDRSGGLALGSTYGQDEILIKHMIQHAGGIPGSYDDIIRVIAPRSTHNGPALLQMARYTNVFLDSQWAEGGEGTLFEFELIYSPTRTDTGSPEGLKLPEPDQVIGTDIRDLGDDKEVYRWNFLIENNLDRDDYSDLIQLCKCFSLSGAALEARAIEVMDVDEWMRTFAMMALCGVGDAYTFGNNHNIRIYVRPEDRKVLAFPWDWDFAFVQSATAALWGNQNLAKIITRP
ncbi:MAG: lamin tail domain-containing protein, partial [Planctomycetes bacterium]|nr:lamin tail domain-containing protein [Planctomycetota bacterium]